MPLSAAWWQTPLGRALLAAEARVAGRGARRCFRLGIPAGRRLGHARGLLAGCRTRRQSVVAAAACSGRRRHHCPTLALTRHQRLRRCGAAAAHARIRGRPLRGGARGGPRAGGRGAAARAGVSAPGACGACARAGVGAASRRACAACSPSGCCASGSVLLGYEVVAHAALPVLQSVEPRPVDGRGHRPDAARGPHLSAARRAPICSRPASASTP